MDIVELGLFYGAEVEGPKVKVQYTLTSMGCPAGAMIQEDIERVDPADPGRRGRRERADVRPAVDAGSDVRRRQVHSRLRLDGDPPPRGRRAARRAVVRRRPVALDGADPRPARRERRTGDVLRLRRDDRRPRGHAAAVRRRRARGGEPHAHASGAPRARSRRDRAELDAASSRSSRPRRAAVQFRPPYFESSRTSRPSP